MTEANNSQSNAFDMKCNELYQHFYQLSTSKSLKEVENEHQVDCNSMKLREFLRLSEVVELNDNISSCQNSVEKVEQDILNNLKKLADSLVKQK